MVSFWKYLLYKKDQSEPVCFLRLFLCLCSTSFAIFRIKILIQSSDLTAFKLFYKELAK